MFFIKFLLSWKSDQCSVYSWHICWKGKPIQGIGNADFLHLPAVCLEFGSSPTSWFCFCFWDSPGWPANSSPYCLCIPNVGIISVFAVQEVMFTFILSRIRLPWRKKIVLHTRCCSYKKAVDNNKNYSFCVLLGFKNLNAMLYAHWGLLS